MSGRDKLMAAKGQAKSEDQAAATDDQLDEKRKDRGYNPVDGAERGSVSAKLNEDSARYKQGPGPF